MELREVLTFVVRREFRDLDLGMGMGVRVSFPTQRPAPGTGRPEPRVRYLPRIFALIEEFFRNQVHIVEWWMGF